MTVNLVERLRAKHDDTWPLKIAFGDLINEDGPEAASRIEELEQALLDIFDHECMTSATSFIACTARDNLWPKKEEAQ